MRPILLRGDAGYIVDHAGQIHAVDEAVHHHGNCHQPHLSCEKADGLLGKEHHRADGEQLFDIDAAHDGCTKEEHGNFHIALQSDDKTEGIGIAGDLVELIGQERGHAVKRQTKQCMAD